MQQQIYIDYFLEQNTNTFSEAAFAAFIQSKAAALFAECGQDWREHNQLSLAFYAKRCRECSNCNGICPHYGHQYHLRLAKGSISFVPYASRELCSKYLRSEDGTPRPQPRKAPRTEWTVVADAEAQGDEPPDLRDSLSLPGVGTIATHRKKKNPQQALF